MPDQQREVPEAEIFATPDEAMSAWLALSKEECVKLDVLAGLHARMRQAYEPGIEGQEILDEAVARIMEGSRKWKLHEKPFATFMREVISSIGADLKRTNEGKVRKASLTEADMFHDTDSDVPISPIENISAGLDTPEEFAIAEDRLRTILDEFVDDDEAWLVLHALFVDGLSPAEVQAELGLSANEFAAARKRIYNRMPNFFLPH